jgi:predicted XRE-type DNA-binding protein/predicted nucleotidyltransferase
MTTPHVDLAEHELSAIARWAEQTPWIFEIRLFGSRAKGTTRPDSDIDLAVTVTSNERGNNALGIFCARADQWKRQLGERTGRPVSLQWYGPESPVYEFLRTAGILIWSRTQPAPGRHRPRVMHRRQAMKDDLSVTRDSGNIFADLDLPDADEHMLKARVAQIVGEMIKESGLTQRAVAARLGLAQSDLSNILRGNLKKFDLVRLLVCLRALGSDIEIKVKRPPVTQPSEVDEAEKRKGRMSLMVA